MRSHSDSCCYQNKSESKWSAWNTVGQVKELNSSSFNCDQHCQFSNLSNTRNLRLCRYRFSVVVVVVVKIQFNYRPCLCRRYFKQSAATFFGLDESKESELRQRWEDRRRRLAERRCGTLRESCSHDVSTRNNFVYRLSIKGPARLASRQL